MGQCQSVEATDDGCMLKLLFAWINPLFSISNWTREAYFKKDVYGILHSEPRSSNAINRVWQIDWMENIFAKMIFSN